MDSAMMRHALGLARRGLGRTWPNPAVGCVLVKDGRILGRGWTQPSGRPHAEVVALSQAGEAARGATAYVTLEPCAHTGKTPPCASALIKAGVARVVVAIEDPDPRVSGKGIEMLREAGITVDMTTDDLRQAAWAANEGFLRTKTQGRPMVTLKLALTLDGRIATRTGESRWITGPAARRQVHMMRADHDAILVGAGTARVDDPLLDVRDLGLADQSPVRVVMDSGLSLSLTSRLAQSAGQVPLWLIHREGAPVDRVKAWRGVGATLLPVSGADHPDAGAALNALAQHGITRVFCEGGGHLAASLLRAGLVDRLVVFSAGKVIGNDGIAGIAAFGLSQLSLAPGFKLEDTRRIGEDLMSIWRPA